MFLMITILLSHMIEVASHQALPHASTAIGKQIEASEVNLLVLRSILFAIYPLMFASKRLRILGLPMDQEKLRAPFFAQCYVAAPAAFVIGLGTILGRSHILWVAAAGLAISVAAVVWYLVVEAVWLRQQAHMKTRSAAWSVFKTWLTASLLNSLISLVVLGT